MLFSPKPSESYVERLGAAAGLGRTLEPSRKLGASDPYVS